MYGILARRENLSLALNVKGMIGIKMSIKRWPNYYFEPGDDFLRYKKILTDKSGVYCYFYRDICLYVGATKNIYGRALRYLRNKNNDWCLTTALIQLVGKYHLNLRIYLYPINKLADTEEHYMEELKPISQTLKSARYTHIRRKIT